MKYDNWQPTKDCPHIENQVVKDLLETNDIKKEVLDGIKGEDNLRHQLSNIIFSYRDYAIREYRQDAAEAMARRLSDAALPAITKAIADVMLPPPQDYPRFNGPGQIPIAQNPSKIDIGNIPGELGQVLQNLGNGGPPKWQGNP
jgi:hypothetical protein